MEEAGVTDSGCPWVNAKLLGEMCGDEAMPVLKRKGPKSMMLRRLK